MPKLTTQCTAALKACRADLREAQKQIAQLRGYDIIPGRDGTPKWEGVSDEVRLRLFSLLSACRHGLPPLMEDIEWFAAYCELEEAS